MELIKNGERVDGRKKDELRPIKIEVGVLKSANGSAYIEWGKNKIICGVYGPKPCVPKHIANPFRAIIRTKYSMSTFASVEGHGKAGPNRRSIEISKVIRDVFEQIIETEKFPGAEIEILIDVLQASGGTRTASITAASAALVNAGIPMRDLISAVAVGKVDGELIVDLGKEEDNYGDGDMPIAMSRKHKHILLMQMDGVFTRDELERAINMAENAINKVQSIQDNAILKFYEREKESSLMDVMK